MRIQPKSKRPKKRLDASILKEIREAVERDAIRWNCSKSWIVATALAAFYGIDIMKPYQDKRKRRAA